MTQSILYYSHNLNPRVAVAVAKHLGSDVRFQHADPMGKDKEWFRPINPNTRVPVLVEPGLTLWEADAIASRLATLADGDFWPSDRAAEIQMWVSWSAYHFIRAGDLFYFENIIVPLWMGREPNEALLASTTPDFHEFAAVLDNYLADKDFLVGNRLSYADFRAATVLPFWEKAKLPVEGYRNILAWHDRLNQIDAWREPFAGID